MESSLSDHPATLGHPKAGPHVSQSGTRRNNICRIVGRLPTYRPTDLPTY